MNGILAIIKKELSHYFFAPMAYIVLSSFLLMNGFIFYIILLALSRAQAVPVSPMAMIFSWTPFWFITVPMITFITMRLGAEERKAGTMETLLTAPLSDLQIVLGKFFSAFAFYFIAWLLTFVYVLVLKAYGDVELGPVFAGYFGALLVGMFFISIGIFTTMVSKNQIVAAIFSFAMLIMLTLIVLFLSYVMSGSGKEILDYMELTGMMVGFSTGVVDTRNVVYLLSGTAFFLAVSVKALEARRWR